MFDQLHLEVAPPEYVTTRACTPHFQHLTDNMYFNRIWKVKTKIKFYNVRYFIQP